MKIFEWVARLSGRRKACNGEARKARIDAEKRLADAKSMWPQTRETRDLLAAWIEDALRGQR